MRPQVHEVKLPGGTLSVPLNFSTLLAVSLVPVDPMDHSRGGVDAGVVVGEAHAGTRWPHIVTAIRVLNAAAGDKSPGCEELAVWGSHKQLTAACVGLCVNLVLALVPPEQKENTTPKA